MTKAHEAGILILNQLKIFNEGSVYFEKVVDPAFLGAIDSCLHSFCDGNKEWDGKFQLVNYSDCFFSHENWNATPDEKKANNKARFDIDCINDNSDSWIALFCGVGTKNGEAGFMFSCQAREFGGKVAWRNHIRNQGKIVDAIETLGFKNQGDGNFFLPIQLNASELAKTWDESGGELKGDDDCFQPVRDALDTIAKSVPLFDALMGSCQGQKTPKKKP